MAFGAEELRVLRRALALALHPGPASTEDVQDCLRLADSLDEAMREGARLRAFLVADLARYRAALPGTAAGYLTLLEEVLDTGHHPGPDDLAALRALRGNSVAATLLTRCQILAERDLRARLDRRTPRRPTSPPTVPAPAAPFPAGPGRAVPAAHVPAPAVVPATVAAAPPVRSAVAHTVPGSRAGTSGSRVRLLALPGGRGDGTTADPRAGEEKKEPAKKPPRPAPRPGPGTGPAEPAGPKPTRRPIPTPGEVFPRRKPGPQSPTADPEQRLAVC
ncbi:MULTISPECIES: hypothetical protein [unclassified Streptomyces]|uniref:hypothetical protein n=1 Tax=unclassified Streptomyces TaxID=2593676 RepID=UPI003D72C9DF